MTSERAKLIEHYARIARAYTLAEKDASSVAAAHRKRVFGGGGHQRNAEDQASIYRQVVFNVYQQAAQDGISEQEIELFVAVLDIEAAALAMQIKAG